jgi:hypothetical protein
LQKKTNFEIPKIQTYFFLTKVIQIKKLSTAKFYKNLKICNFYFDHLFVLFLDKSTSHIACPAGYDDERIDYGQIRMFLDGRPLRLGFKKPGKTRDTSLQCKCFKKADYSQRMKQDLIWARNLPPSKLHLQIVHKHQHKHQQVRAYKKQ